MQRRSKPLTNHAMKKALLLPFWTTGVLPTVIGFIFDNQIIVLLGAFLIGGAAGILICIKNCGNFLMIGL